MKKSLQSFETQKWKEEKYLRKDRYMLPRILRIYIVKM